MDNTGLAESDSPSDIDEQTKAWESDLRSVRAHLAQTDGIDDAVPQIECGIGHRVQASRSVLALVVDEDCVFAGLQGGDIVVCADSLIP
jgi:di- and tripeptidase